MSPTIGADVSEDLKDQVDEYAETGESRSKALTRLIRAGLKSERAKAREQERRAGFSGIVLPVVMSLVSALIGAVVASGVCIP